MSLLGIHLTLLIGPKVPIPAPPMLLDELESVEVTHSDEGRSGFQITFQVGRSGPLDLLDYRLLSLPLLRPFSRVILIVAFNAMPLMLMDGFITRQELSPSDEPGESALTITGEDVGVMMDLEETIVAHPAQDETIIANKIILSYAKYGLVPVVIPPPVVDLPIPVERVPIQHGTDLAYLQQMAARFGYVFYITPGPAPFTNTAYWGPPRREGVPQKALSVNMGPETNVESIHFQNNALAPTRVSGWVQDRLTNESRRVQISTSTRPRLVSKPTLSPLNPNVRTSLLKHTGGLTRTHARARAQAMTDTSVDEVVTATGELDALRYGDLLQARGVVGLRGVGYSYDGTYYVKRVTHHIRKGEYRQRFTLTREGIGALTPTVRP